MNKSKASLLIALIFLITSCAESEPPVEVFYDDVTNEQMFINIKNNDLDEVITNSNYLQFFLAPKISDDE